MQLAMMGLGRMGMGMTRRLLAGAHQVVVHNRGQESVNEAAKAGATPATSLADAVAKVSERPRVVWLMLPAGDVTGGVMRELTELLGEGDIVIDGGNSNYRDSIERAAMFQSRGIFLLDIGVSGGVWGERNGFTLMAGGDAGAFAKVEPALKTLAPEGGYLHAGPSGAGHFTKMVHNGIEYGMMQAIAEGFELMSAKKEFGLDLPAISRLWMNGSVVRSWLLELTGNALADDPALESVEPYVEDSGEGRWTVLESIDLGVPLPVITLALQMRFRSRQPDSYAARLLAALRNQFGGHTVRRRKV